MKTPNILLTLSGSRPSERAAELCWSLARKSGWSISAQHVVDTEGAKRLLGCHEPGLIGSGPYAEALEATFDRQRSIAETLIEKYCSLYRFANQADSRIFIDEGDPLAEILKRASNYDIVAAGRSGAFERTYDSAYHVAKTRLDEALAETCPSPLLLVSDDFAQFTAVKVLISPYEENLDFLRQCLSFTNAIERELIVVAIYTRSRDMDAFDIRDKLEKTLPEGRHIPFGMRLLESLEEPDAVKLFDHCNSSVNVEVSKDILLVMPTRKTQDGSRVTLLGTSASKFVRSASVSPMLLWPEEFMFRSSDEASFLQKMHHEAFGKV